MKPDQLKRKPKGLTALSAVTHAFLEHNNQLKLFLRRFIHRQQDIEDIAQEAFIKAFKTEKSNGVSHPKTLIFTIAKNIALNELRSKARRVTDYIEECQSEPETIEFSIEEEVQALDGLQNYCSAVDALPEQCRRVYLMRKVHGLTHKEIAERLQITVRSVERHLQKGALKCKAYLDEKETSASDLNIQPNSNVRTLSMGREK